jgi:hypothetical protein
MEGMLVRVGIVQHYTELGMGDWRWWPATPHTARGPGGTDL